MAALLFLVPSLASAAGPDPSQDVAHHWQAVVITILALAQAALTVYLLVNRRRRQRAELALGRSEAKLMAFINSSEDAICIRDRERRLVVWNGVFAKAIKLNCGVDAEVGMRAEDYLDPEVLPQYEAQRELQKRALAGEAQKGGCTYACPDGKTLYLEMSWSPIRDGDRVTGLAEITRDCTERREMDLDLRTSEKRFRALMRNSVEAIWCIEMAPPIPLDLAEDEQIEHIYRFARIAEANDAWARQTGHENGEEMIGMMVSEFLPQTEPENTAILREIVRCNYSLTNFISRECYGDGEMQVFINNVVGGIEDGHVPRVWGTSRDITAGEAARERLRNAEEKYRTVVENASESIYVAQDEKVKYCNAQALAIMGYSEDEFHSKRFVEFIHPDDRSKAREEYGKRLSGEKPSSSYTIRVVTKSGSERWVIVNSVRIDWEGRPATLAMLSDITELRAVQDQLRETETKYRTVAEFTYDWESWEAPDGAFLYVSPSCERITGYSSDEFISDPSLIARILAEEDLEVWWEHREEVRQGHHERVEFRIRTRSGEIRWLEHACIRVTGPAGEFLGLRASNRDITLRKQAEDEANKHRDTLAHMARLTTMGELAASLAHELNQPLTGILSNAQAARMYLGRDEPDLEVLAEIVDDIIADDKRAGEVIRRLRAFLTKGQHELAAVDMGGLIRDTVEIIRNETMIQGVSVTVDVASEALIVLGDAVQLQQVLVNFCVNGEQAMAQMPAEDRALAIHAQVGEQGNVCVWVRDHGPGIAPEALDRVFEPFYSTKPEGMGMGLAICRSIMEAHGGRIWAENVPDGGVAMWLELPLANS
ncbi:MAG: PAS domain S-box protein [Victivallales bacterium]|nr:PAS domain S-box protein [Victivallales bacterium]